MKPPIDRQTGTRRSGGTSALVLSVAVGVMALPSAVLAISSGVDTQVESGGSQASEAGFVPSEVDPRLARSITVRSFAKGQTFRFTPAATPNPLDTRVITVVVRLPSSGTGLATRGAAPGDAVKGVGGLRIAPTAYSLGATRGYRSFAQNPGAGATAVRRLEIPDLSSFRPRDGAGRGDPARFAPRVVLDEREQAGRSPRTFEQNDQTVDLGGSYRVTGNLNVTAGVRYSSERDRLVPLTDGSQDSQAVYVGTQFRF